MKVKTPYVLQVVEGFTRLEVRWVEIVVEGWDSTGEGEVRETLLPRCSTVLRRHSTLTEWTSLWVYENNSPSDRTSTRFVSVMMGLHDGEENKRKVP